ncbi:MAG: hypothetical protein WC661_21330 [Opitutaceae bacterium]|jgi:hypothetical protein
MLVKNNALVSLTPTADHSEKEGFFIKLAGITAALVTAATDLPFGVIVDGEPVTGKDSVAVGAAYPGIVTVKLGAVPGAVVAGSRLQLNADGTVKLDTGAGARVLVAIAIEAGAADELIQAVLIKPVVIGNAVVIGSTNGTAAAAIPGALTSTNGTAAAAAADLAALAAEAEKIGDDVRAIHAAALLAQAESEKQGDDIRALYAALQAAGILA